MGNMSYCRFHNTLGDLEDCYEHMSDETNSDGEGLSDGESDARRDLIELCRKIASEYEIER